MLASPRQVGTLSLLTFAALLVTQKREKGKVFSNLFYKRHLIRQPAADTFCPSLGDADRICSANRSIPHWRRLSTRFFFCICRRKRKSYQKENAEIRISRSAERDHRCRWTTPPFEKGGRKLYYGNESLNVCAKEKNDRGMRSFLLYFDSSFLSLCFSPSGVSI